MVWKHEGSSKLQKWPFHDDLWLRFVLKKELVVNLMIFQDEVSRLKNILGNYCHRYAEGSVAGCLL